MSFILLPNLKSVSSLVPSIPVVEEGLVLHLDAANSDSYSGNGSIWYDLKGNVNATLENSPLYSTSQGGYFSLNGSNQGMSITDTAGINDFNGTQNYSIEIWIRADSTQNGAYSNQVAIVEKWAGSGTYPYAIRLDTSHNGGVGAITSRAYDGSSSPQAYTAMIYDQWIQHVSVFDWTNDTVKNYINGQASGTRDISAMSTNVSNNISTQIGRRGSSYYFTGDVSIFRIYDKALELEEISQNYSANKTRYGL